VVLVLECRFRSSTSNEYEYRFTEYEYEFDAGILAISEGCPKIDNFGPPGDSGLAEKKFFTLLADPSLHALPSGFQFRLPVNKMGSNECTGSAKYTV
jgi:hypothetical protein